MVFVRNVVRLVRPSMLGRCLTARPGSTTVHSVASFPSWTPTRALHSTPLLGQEAALQDALDASGHAREPAAEQHEHQPLAASASASASAPTPTPTSAQTCTEAFERLVEQTSPAPIEQYEAIFKTLSDDRDFGSSFALLKRLRESPVRPSSAIYSYVARAGRRTLRIREIREFFGESLQREQEGERVGEEATTGCSPLYHEFKEVLRMMEEDGAELNMFFYEDLAYSLGVTQQAGLLINVAVAMEKRGVQPSTMFYNKMLYVLPRNGLSDRADVLFSRMVMNNLADQSSYISRIGSLVYLNRTSDAESCFRDMCKLYGMNDIACNSLIHGYLQGRREEAALEILETMKKDPRCPPNRITANTFVTYYYTSNNLATAPAVLEYFGTIGFPSEPADHANLIKLFARNDQKRALEIVKDLVAASATTSKPLNINIYNAVLSVLTDRLVPATFKTGVARVLIPDQYPIRPNGLAALCINCTADFRQVIARMDSEKIPATSVTYDLIMRAQRARNDHDAVVHAFQHLLRSGQTIYSSHRNSYLSALISKADVSGIQSFVQAMGERRQIVNDFNAKRLAEMGISMPRTRFARAESQPSFADNAARNGHFTHAA